MPTECWTTAGQLVQLILSMLIFDRVTGLGHRRAVVDIVYLDRSEPFDTVPYDFLISQLVKCDLDDITIRWLHDWLKNCTQRVISCPWFAVKFRGCI